MNCLYIETVLANHFNPRQNIIVPNVSWGLDIHECDMLIVTPAGYATEIEIKTSPADLRRDMLKRHCHGKGGRRIKRLYFAIPEQMANMDNYLYIPDSAGILIIQDDNRWRAFEARAPQNNGNAQPLTDIEITHLLHLGCMRIWTLKENILRYCQPKIK